MYVVPINGLRKSFVLYVKSQITFKKIENRKLAIYKTHGVDI